MSYPPKNRKLLKCDKCGVETDDILIRVEVQKRLGIFEESYCVECVVVSVYKDEMSRMAFVRSTGIVPLD